MTQYFYTRDVNYINTVLKECLQFSDAWIRFEFAKYRGMIHRHGLFFSPMHSEKMKKAMLSENWDEKARQLDHFLQKDTEENELFSPRFISMHPGGGDIITENNMPIWELHKHLWCPP